jgi:uncharacterized protein YcbX
MIFQVALQKINPERRCFPGNYDQQKFVRNYKKDKLKLQQKRSASPKPKRRF